MFYRYHINVQAGKQNAVAGVNGEPAVPYATELYFPARNAARLLTWAGAGHIATMMRSEIRAGLPPAEWKITDRPVAYEPAVEFMTVRAEAIAAGDAAELVWLLEHPPLYTAGTSAREEDLLAPGRFPVYRTGRGGQYTYHGPGQRVAYVMLDLKRRGHDVRSFVRALEDWIISALAEFNVRGERRTDRVGVWVRRPGGREDKIAAIGIRLRRWVSFHGIALNVEPDLSHFEGIVPCGIRGHGVTSLVDLGIPVTMHEVDMALKRTFTDIFGPTVTSAQRAYRNRKPLSPLT